MKEKQIQISETLFNQLIQFHILGQTDLQSDIVKGLENKVSAINRRTLYTLYKNNGDDQARLDYLKVSGVPEIYIY